MQWVQISIWLCQLDNPGIFHEINQLLGYPGYIYGTPKSILISGIWGSVSQFFIQRSSLSLVNMQNTQESSPHSAAERESNRMGGMWICHEPETMYTWSATMLIWILSSIVGVERLGLPHNFFGLFFWAESLWSEHVGSAQKWFPMTSP